MLHPQRNSRPDPALPGGRRLKGLALTDTHPRRPTASPSTLASTETGEPDTRLVRAPAITSDRKFWTYFSLSAICAILVPVVVVGVGQLTEDGPVRLLLTWVIPLLMGLAVYASAAATNATRRTR